MPCYYCNEMIDILPGPGQHEVTFVGSFVAHLDCHRERMEADEVMEEEQEGVGVIVYDAPSFKMKSLEDGSVWEISNLKLKVIGNRFENPELLAREE